MKRKLLSILLSMNIVLSLLPSAAIAAEGSLYGDTAGHWAERSIGRWSGYKVVQGVGGAAFDPNGELTCAQLAAILARLLRLPAAQSAGFTDNPADAWYADAIDRCAAAGILVGSGDGTVSPTAPLSRERVMVIVGRALGYAPIENADLSEYGDAEQVAPYAQSMVAALVEAGVVVGVSEGVLAPQSDIDRASTVALLDRVIRTYANEGGASVTADGGLTVVVADGVTVTGSTERLFVPASEIDVLLESAGSTNAVTITGNDSTVTVKRTDLESGEVIGEHSRIILDSAAVQSVTLSGSSSVVETTGSTTVGALTVTGENAVVETKGSAKIESIAVSKEATGATVTTGSGTTIGSVENSAEGTTVTGSGTVKSVESSKDVAVETKGTKVGNSGEDRITVTDKAGRESSVNSGSGTTTSSGSSGHSHSIAAGWSHDAENHWHEAGCGIADHRSGVAAHEWSDWTEVAPATCTSDGSHTHACTVCGYEAAEALPAAHDYSVKGESQCAACGAENPDVVAEITTGKAIIKGNKYTSIEKALEAEGDMSKTVKLLKDITLDHDLYITTNGASKTLELGGYALTFTGDSRLIVRGNNTAAITGGGTIESQSTSPDVSVIIVETGVKNFNLAALGTGDTKRVTVIGQKGIEFGGTLLTVKNATIKTEYDAITVTNGKVNVQNNGSSCPKIESTAGSCLAAGGTAAAAEIVNKKNITMTARGDAPVISWTSGGKLTIKGGTFEGRTTVQAKEGNVSITGGTFRSIPANMQELCADGYVADRQSDGTYVVQNGAVKVTYSDGSVKYCKSLCTALSEANQATGAVVTILKDFTETAQGARMTSGEATLDLNGKTVTVTGTNEMYPAAITLLETAQLTVTDSSEAKTGKLIVPGMYGAIAGGTSTLTIEGGIFEVGDATAVQAQESGKAFIKGGTFERTNAGSDEYGSGFLLNLIDQDRATANISVTGGTFIGFNPANNAAEGAETNFVAEGYTAKETTVDEKEAWTVTAETAADDAV